MSGTVSAPDIGRLAASAREDLADWVRYVSADGPRPAGKLAISLEIALAQGFTFAANNRTANAAGDARMYLAQQAEEMLAGSRYWYSQLALLHALCLFALSQGDGVPGSDGWPAAERVVQSWLNLAARNVPGPDGAAEVHPFVREAGLLAGLALKAGRPQRYCWIDEREIIQQVGSRSAGRIEASGRHHLWIPSSAGWEGLSHRAQQLLADVVLLMSLTDRDDDPEGKERRLRRADRQDLPPCLTHYRPALEPGRSACSAQPAVPGDSCVDYCVFELCPYPPQGEQPSWMELSEASSLPAAGTPRRPAPPAARRRGLAGNDAGSAQPLLG